MTATLYLGAFVAGVTFGACVGYAAGRCKRRVRRGHECELWKGKWR
jgi:hypothetical protein